MIGIVSYGAHIPRYRISRQMIGDVWKNQAAIGERSVANWDEDSVTMAAGAVLDCINGIDRNMIGGLFFATTTPPFLEKSGAHIIAAATDLPREIRTVDFTTSIAAGAKATASAIDAVKDSSTNVIVVASDHRLGATSGNLEQLLGDGAAALLIGTNEVIAEIEASYDISEEVINIWRHETDRYIRVSDRRFITMHYSANMKSAIYDLLKQENLEIKDFAKIIFNAPDPRSHNDLAKMLGVDTKKQLQDPLYSTVGDTGAASTTMMLIAALERAKPGDKLLVATYAGGVNVLILTVTNNIVKLGERLGITGNLALHRDISSYEKFLVLQERLDIEEALRPDPDPPQPINILRERSAILSLYGSKCQKCNTVQYPPQRVCVFCKAKDSMTGYRLADRKGKVFTFTKDYISVNPDPPTLETVIDFDEGGRIICALTDCDSDKVSIGMPVAMSFRKLYTSDGIVNYFWKAVPTANNEDR